MNKILISILCLAVIFVAACSSTPVNPADVPSAENNAQRVVDTTSDSNTRVVSANRPSESDLAELQSSFKVETVDYVQSSANQYGDESATRRIAGTNLYTLESVVNYRYSPSSNLADKTVYYELRGLGLDGKETNVVSSGVLDADKNSLSAEFIIEHTGASPDMNFCFGASSNVGDDHCYSFSTVPVSNKLTVSSDTIKMDPDASKNFIVSNDGNAPITAFFFAPEGENVDISLSESVLTLDGGETQIVTITTTSNVDGDVNEDYVLNVYAISDNCDISNTCGNGARIRNKIELEVD